MVGPYAVQIVFAVMAKSVLYIVDHQGNRVSEVLVSTKLVHV